MEDWRRRGMEGGREAKRQRGTAHEGRQEGSETGRRSMRRRMDTSCICMYGWKESRTRRMSSKRRKGGN